jgi:hypothetical protein
MTLPFESVFKILPQCEQGLSSEYWVNEIPTNEALQEKLL